MIEAKKMIKSGQEQAVASWINYLNQVRLDRLMEALQKEELNLNEAMSTISETLKTISRDIVNNGKGRGGQYGMHGFIAEVAECGIGNAREQIEGKAPIYEWINDNGPEDLRRGATLIQQKFVNGGGHLSLQAIRMHLNAYPDFLDNGGVYQIPEDHYEKIKWLLSISEKEANKMPTSTGDFSLKQWREVHEFFKNGDIPLDKVEPSKLKYSEVQKGTYEQTFSKEKGSLRKRNQERKEQAYNKSKPTLSEGVKATAAAAAMEGAMALCLEIAEKRKSGKKFNAFDEDDWKEIAATTGKGTLKGGIRGASIYTLTNFTATPAAVASAMVTATFGIAEQAYQLKQGNVDEQRFIENSEMLCLDASVSALSSFAGQDFDWATGNFHDACIEEQKILDGGELYLRFTGIWGCQVEIWFWDDLEYCTDSRNPEYWNPYWSCSTLLLFDGYVFSLFVLSTDKLCRIVRFPRTRRSTV